VYLIAGLGNPGDKFNGTRHNIGFYVIDLLSEKYRIPVRKIRHKGLLGQGRIGEERVLLLKPQTFMNLSGESLLSVTHYYDIEPAHIIVVYDDVDLEPGVTRIRPSGSAGSHKGMKSVIYHLQTDQFPRVRIGIGRQGPEEDLADYVLSRFRDEDIPPVKQACEKAVTGIEWIISDGVELAMSRVNGRA
jgi:PTH1 family peptidyl-tRNA hydrolase